MIKSSYVFDTNDELILRRHRGGVILEKPSSQNQMTMCSIKSFFSLPFSSYFVSADNRFITGNDVCMKITGVQSERDFIGNTLEKFVTKELSAVVDANNNSVIQTASMKIIEETGDRIDDVRIQALSFKFPWYCEDKVVGIFGCSVPVSTISVAELANMISQLMLMGLLTQTYHFPSGQPVNANGLYLTKRENEVLAHLMRAKTAKEIGQSLGISHKTVQNHIENLKTKTGCRSKSELFEKFATQQESV